MCWKTGRCLGDNDFNYYDSILSFDINTEIWTQVGQMKKKRYRHAISVVDAEEVLNFCLQ